MLPLRQIKPKNARTKRYLDNKAPQITENPRTTLFLRYTSSSEILHLVMTDLFAIKRPLAIKFTKKNAIHPFEDPSSLEFFAEKNDASLMLYASHSKKRPHCLTAVRFFGYKVLDMVELMVDGETMRTLGQFKNAKAAVGMKPLISFSGSAWEAPEEQNEYTAAKSVLLDLFKGQDVQTVDVEGLQYMIHFSVDEPQGQDAVTKPQIHMRCYLLRTKRQPNSTTPRVELEEMGPRIDFRVGRVKQADADMWKEAMRKPKGQEPKTKKNVDTDIIGDKVGRIHLGKQDLGQLQTRKMKGLKRSRDVESDEEDEEMVGGASDDDDEEDDEVVFDAHKRVKVDGRIAGIALDHSRTQRHDATHDTYSSSFTAHNGPARPPRIPQQRNTLPRCDSLISTTSTDLLLSLLPLTPFHLLSPEKPTVAYATPANTAFEAANSTIPNNLSNHRRRTSRGVHAPSQGGRPSNLSPTKTTFRDTPFEEDVEEAAPRSTAADYAFAPAPAGAAMSLDHSPSPQRGGGWSSPGLTTPYEDVNPGSGAVSRSRSPAVKSFGDLNGGAPGGATASVAGAGAGGVTWASAKSASARVNGYPRYQSQNEGFFTRHYRKISEGLPYFAHGGQEDRYAEKEKLGRGRLAGPGGFRELPRRLGLLMSRRRKYVVLVLFFVLALMMWYNTALTFWWRRTSFLGGGSKYVMILGANIGGGVMEWKGAREWAIERDSVRNKKKYAARWGYELEIVDMSTKKRYAHEWRESWEKVDVIRNAMRKYPDAEWFWWLDLNTFIMEPTYSLQSHLFNDLGSATYRDINIHNPLNIQHPPNGTSNLPPEPDLPPYQNYLDDETSSPNGDGDPNSIHLLVPQDCAGFNLGSFFVRRSAWTDRLLDIWWDPVFYEQKHMEWEHKEQDALEYIYANQPWIRKHVGFVPQRMINAFPHGACGDDRGLPPVGGCKAILSEAARLERIGQSTPGLDFRECGVAGVHYQELERDFLVNMAGCEWGRDCWGEMYNFRQLSNRLNRSRWEKVKDWFGESWESRRREEGKKEEGKKE
ncbi:galactosyl transferase GMA12/MNN10 family protein [Hortaea werneckii]|nr:galactosyl transferase GMA12/MNN10 family protein [Hortaea werneckii]